MLPQQQDEYLTTKELAELLRIKERKVYDLASAGDVPCIRVVGKLLFPRSEIEAWLSMARSGPVSASAVPAVFGGSHDPLLEWALRESGCGIAAMFDGSFDGLRAFSEGRVLACGLHIHQPDGWNLSAVGKSLGAKPYVVLAFAVRKRGLIVAPGNPLCIDCVADLADRRFARRQESAASFKLFRSLAEEAGLDPDALQGPQVAARTEDDVALMVLEGQADAALGLAGVAKRLGLGSCRFSMRISICWCPGTASSKRRFNAFWSSLARKHSARRPRDWKATTSATWEKSG